MKIDCMHGYTEKIKAGNITFEARDVEVFGGVCSHADLCGIQKCEFYDITQAGTDRFMTEKLEAASTIEALMEDRRQSEQYLKRQELGLKVIQGGNDDS